MVKMVLTVCVGSIFLISCLKKNDGCQYGSDSAVAPASEQSQIKSYLDSAGITANLSPYGFYYQVISPGNGASPGQCSQVTVSYKGWLTKGTVFDQSSSSVFILGGLIDGWRESLPLIRQGGEIRVYIPPSLGYGVASNPVITPNSILIFDIFLLDVQ
jgi:FKBP-type peptidyl-prolyl cis-trans isomerase FkpA